MFDSIAINPNAPLRTHVDLGEIAEALLFYGQVHLLLNEVTLVELIRLAGIDTILAMLESDFVKIVIFRDGIATHSSGDVFDFIVWERAIAPNKTRSNLEIVSGAIEQATGNRAASRRAAYRLLNHGTVRGVNYGVPAAQGISELARHDIEDRRYVRASVESILVNLTGSPPPDDWRFEINRVENGLVVDSNLDYAALTSKMRVLHNTGSDLSTGLILDFFNAARMDLFHAAQLNSELLTSTVSETLIRHRLLAAIGAGTNQFAELALFQKVTLNRRSVAEAVRLGHRTLDEVLHLVEKAQEFRKWIQGRSFDAELLSQYIAALDEDPAFLARLPRRIVRFLIFASGVALDLLPAGAGTLAGLGVSLIDTFLVDRIRSGWTPSQFIDRELIPFVSPDDPSVVS